MLATRCCRSSTGVLAHWRSLWRLCGEWSMLLIARPDSSHRCSMGFSDVLLLQILSHYPGMIKRSIVILVEEIVSKVLPSMWYQGVARCPDTPRYWRSYPGTQGVKLHPCGMPPSHGQNPSSWQPGSIAGSVLLAIDELSRRHRQPTAENVTHPPDGVKPSCHTKFLPPPCTV